MTSKILVLDDEENYTRMLQDLLEQNHFVVETATMPTDAIKRLEQERFDLVVSDYKMPVMDGAAFLKKAREIYPSLPIILVSGLMNTPELVKVANMSVTLVLEKPLNTAEFLKQVSRFAKPAAVGEALANEDTGSTYLGADSRSAEKQAIFNFPDPIFFSATCLASKNILEAAWNQVSNDARLLVIQQPEGGDAELLVKEVAFWKSKGIPKAVHFYKLEQLFDESGLKELEDIILDREASSVVGIHIGDGNRQIGLQELISTISERIGEANAAAHFFPVFIFSDRRAQPSLISGSFSEKYPATSLLTLPTLALRSSDIAAYIKRELRQFEEKEGMDEGQLTLSPEAAFALLIYEWPDNYAELCSALRLIVKQRASDQIDLETVASVFEERVAFSVAAASATRTERLSLYLRHRQSLFIRHLIDQEGMSVERIADLLGLKTDRPSSEEELLESPLIDPNLAKLS